jgi:hypothetical protein
MSSTAVIRYQTRPEAGDDNQQLVEAVFADLHQLQPAGIDYRVYRLDGQTFVHVFTAEEEADDILASLPTFQAFLAQHADRRTGPVERAEGTEIGRYSGDRMPVS